MNANGTPLALDTAACAILYREGRHEELAAVFLDLLQKFRASTYYDIDASTTHFVNVFIKNFLFYLTQEDFAATEAQLLRFVENNAVICNVAAMSAFKTTDPFLQLLLAQRKNFAKVLALYNPRCKSRLDIKQFFAADKSLTCAWYYAYFENYRAGNASKNCWEQMREHLYSIDLDMRCVTGQMHHAYFGATYVDFERDHELKQVVNESLRTWMADLPPVINKPKRGKACVITSMWFAGHSVYRCMRKFIEALAEVYDLTLISLGSSDNAEKDLFTDGVKEFSLANVTDRSAFEDNNFELAFFPDIGMNMESIYLANTRIAPVQVCGYGHPVSTRGTEIDYWLGGLETEDQAAAEANYSERLVLIPGAGVMPNKPQYERNWNHQSSPVVRINCSWSAQKINYFNLSLLRRIAENTRSNVHFRFFPGGSVMCGAYIALRQEIGEVLGPNAPFQVLGSLSYESYMSVMEDAEFTLDPYPFGGYATATDALFLGKPLVTLEGHKFYNRSAGSLLHKLGLHELVAQTEDEYVDIACRLIDDAGYRQAIVDRIEAFDLNASIFADDSSKQFTRAMQYLVKHHSRLQADTDRSPLVFE